MHQAPQATASSFIPDQIDPFLNPTDNNTAKPQGQKQYFNPQQAQALARHLEDQKAYRDLALLCLSIDSMLRSVDVLNLKVADVTDAKGVVLDGFVLPQAKTGKGVEVALLEYTRTALTCWMAAGKLERQHFLFPGQSGPNKPLTAGQFRRIVKAWARFLGLNPDRYACHSLRRSKPTFMFADQVQPAYLRHLLGHASLTSTQEYLGADRQTALALARQYDMFNHETDLCPLSLTS